MELIVDLDQLPRPVLVAVVITIVCRAIKAIPNIRDWTIPWVALLLGSLIYPALVRLWTVESMIAGLIIGGATVGLYSTAKQTIVTRVAEKTGQVPNNPVVNAIFGSRPPQGVVSDEGDPNESNSSS